MACTGQELPPRLGKRVNKWAHNRRPGFVVLARYDQNRQLDLAEPRSYIPAFQGSDDVELARNGSSCGRQSDPPRAAQTFAEGNQRPGRCGTGCARRSGSSPVDTQSLPVVPGRLMATERDSHFTRRQPAFTVRLRDPQRDRWRGVGEHKRTQPAWSSARILHSKHPALGLTENVIALGNAQVLEHHRKLAAEQLHGPRLRRRSWHALRATAADLVIEHARAIGHIRQLGERLQILGGAPGRPWRSTSGVAPPRRTSPTARYHVHSTSQRTTRPVTRPTYLRCDPAVNDTKDLSLTHSRFRAGTRLLWMEVPD